MVEFHPENYGEAPNDTYDPRTDADQDFMNELHHEYIGVEIYWCEPLSD